MNNQTNEDYKVNVKNSETTVIGKKDKRQMYWLS